MSCIAPRLAGTREDSIQGDPRRLDSSARARRRARVSAGILNLSYSCYNPKYRNLSPSITFSVFGYLEKFLD
jgi:hypothetical protein